MGVYRLSKFMDAFGIKEDINLRDAANDWRLNGGLPTIVVDILNFARQFYGDGGGSSICCEEYKKIAENIKAFLQAFKDISIDLVIFFDGPVDESKLDRWITRRHRKLMQYKSTFERIESKHLSKLQGDIFPCLILQIMREVIKEENCIVLRGVDDHDKEMAKYVVDNKCLGILSDDTDFVVFDGVPNVFTDLKTAKMTAKVYRRRKLLEKISLKSEAMPIFATLLGNDYIDTEFARDYSLRKFKTSQPHFSIYAQLANSIHNQSRSREEAARRLATEIFQSEDRWETTFDSLCSYDLNFARSKSAINSCLTGFSQWDAVVECCLEKFKEGRVENQTVSIVKRSLCTQSEKFEDPNDSHVDILKGLRQRIFSILLHEKLLYENDLVVTEIMAGGAYSMERHQVQPLKVEVAHPGLTNLWNNGEELDDQRWELIWWALRSTKDSPGEALISFNAVSEFRNLSDHLMVVGLALLYLDQVVKQLNEKERTVLMVLATSVPQMGVAKLSRYRTNFTKKRAVHLATLYMQTYSWTRWVMDVSGLRLTAKWRDVYSGQLFHYLFQLDEPLQFFQESGTEARKNYEELRTALNLARGPSNQPIPAHQPVPTENPSLSRQDDRREPERVGGDGREQGRAGSDQEGRRILEGRSDWRRDLRQNQRQNRRDMVWQHRNSEGRDQFQNRNNSREYAWNQHSQRFNGGRRRENYRWRGSERDWYQQNRFPRREKDDGYSRHLRQRRYQ